MRRLAFTVGFSRLPSCTAQERGVAVVRGKPRFYDPPRLREARAVLMQALWGHAPEEPLEGAVGLEVHWVYAGRAARPEWKTTRPDTDNLDKMLKDCMTELGFWRDDAQVARELILKYRSADGAPLREGLYVSAEELGRYYE